MTPFSRIDERVKMLFPSDAEFQRVIGAPAKSVDNWRAGRNKSWEKKILAIADVLETTPQYLQFKTDDPTPPQPRESKTPAGGGGRKAPDYIAMLTEAVQDVTEQEAEVIRQQIQLVKSLRAPKR